MQGRLENILNKKTIDVSNKELKTKSALFEHMVQMLYKADCIDDKILFLEKLFEREKTGSTYMGNGIAVPHGKADCVLKPSIAFCRCAPFVYDKDEDGDEMVELAFMLAIPTNTKQEEYLRMLANITKLFLDEQFLQVLKTENDKDKIMDEFTTRFRAVVSA